STDKTSRSNLFTFSPFTQKCTREKKNLEFMLKRDFLFVHQLCYFNVIFYLPSLLSHLEVK
uniref:Uncharacterized protein n=1 Tax=Fundulus heteroclitus TaxID=8078 RepID=A0A3Q2PT40_FUNHE